VQLVERAALVIHGVSSGWELAPGISDLGELALLGVVNPARGKETAVHLPRPALGGLGGHTLTPTSVSGSCPLSKRSRDPDSGVKFPRPGNTKPSKNKAVRNEQGHKRAGG